MRQKRRRKDPVEEIDIESLEDDLTEARSILSEVEKHNNVLEGKVSAAFEKLDEKGFKTIKTAEKEATKIEDRVRKETPKLKEKLDKFYEDFDVLKEMLP
jgi:hypothetical protein